MPKRRCYSRNSIQNALLLILGISALLPTYRAFAASLTEVVTAALENNLALQSAQLSYEATEQERGINRAQFLPSIEATANTRWNETETERIDQDQDADYNTHGYSISLSQTLFSLGDIYTYNTASLEIDTANLQFSQQRQLAIQEVANAYFEVLRSDAQIRATQSELDSTQARYQQLKRNIELGNIAGSEIYEVDAQQEQVSNDLRTLTNERKVQLRELERLIQNPVTVDHDLSSDAILEPLTSATIAQMEARLNRNNLDILVAKQQIGISRSELRGTGAEFVPTLSGSVFYNYDDSNAPRTDPLETGITDQWVYGITLEVPILNGGRDYYRYQQASIELDQSQIDLEEQIALASQQFFDSVTSLNDNAAALDSLRRIIKANNASYQGMKKAYNLGTRTITDLLTAESKLFNSIRDFENARYAYVIELINLERLMGGLDVARIQAIAGLMSVKGSSATQSAIPLHLIDSKEAKQ